MARTKREYPALSDPIDEKILKTLFLVNHKSTSNYASEKCLISIKKYIKDKYQDSYKNFGLTEDAIKKTIYFDRKDRRVGNDNLVKALQSIYNADNIYNCITHPKLENYFHKNLLKELKIHQAKPSLDSFLECENEACVQDFIDKYTTNQEKYDYSNINESKQEVQIEEKTSTHKNRYLSIPRLDKDYLSNIENLEKMKKLLFSDEYSEIGVLGRGGLGKSSLVTSLANNKEVREYFKDGIYFVQLGYEVDDKEIKKLYEELASSLYIETTNINRNELKRSFNNKKVLLIIDNVWNIQYLKSDFNILDSNTASKLIFTSRKRAIAKNLKAKQFDIDFTKKQALQLLEKKVGVIDPKLLGDVEDILNKVAYLPLAVVIIGDFIKQNNLEDRLKNILNKLETSKIDKIYQLDPVNDYHENLMIIIQLSVDNLKKFKENYFELSIFNVETKINPETLKIYWGEYDYINIVDELINSSLLFENIDIDGKVYYYLHDLEKSFILNKVINESDEDKEVLKYRKLIDNYKKFCNEQWYKIPIKNEYFYNNYIYICKIIKNELLAKEISKSILYKQNNLSVVNIKEIINLLKLNKINVAKKILVKSHNERAVEWALTIYGKTQNKENFLKKEDISNHNTIFRSIFNFPDNSEVVQDFSKEYLKDTNNLAPSLTENCLYALGKQSEIVHYFAKEYLNDSSNYNISIIHFIIHYLNMSSKKAEDFARDYLENTRDYNCETIKCCLLILGEQVNKERSFAERYLDKNSNCDSNITIECLTILGDNSTVAKSFAEKYLDENNNFDSNITIKCLKILGESSEISKRFTGEWLENFNLSDQFLASECLKILGREFKEAQDYAKVYLDKQNCAYMRYKTVQQCIQILGKDSSEVINFAKKWFRHRDTFDSQILDQCIEILGDDAKEEKLYKHKIDSNMMDEYIICF